MLSQLPSPWGLSLRQLRDLERACRVLALRARKPQAVNLFLTLSDRFDIWASEREAELRRTRQPGRKPGR